MMTWQEQLNHSLYSSKSKALIIVKIISIFNAIAAVCLIIYDIGFAHTPNKMTLIHEGMDGIFAIYAITYLTKVLYSFQRFSYLKATKFEAFVSLIIISMGISRYFFDFHLFEYIFKTSAVGVEGYLEFYDTFITLCMLYFVGYEFIKASSILNSLALQPSTTFIFSFIILIGLGTFLFMLPEMHVSDSPAGGPDSLFMTSFFTSVSASCVTGLSIVNDIGAYFTFKGQIVLLVLMQLGGIGIVSFATFFATFMKGGVGIKHQVIIQDFLNSESLFSAKGLLRQVIFITLSIEAIIAVFIFFTWGSTADQEIFHGSLLMKIFYSVFHAVSAFCNAGFCLVEGGLYNSSLQNSFLLHIVIGITIIIGSLGFSTIQDIFSFSKLRERLEKPWKNWKLSSKIAVWSAIVLIIVGMVLFYILEKDRSTLQGMNTFERIIASFFQSVTTRTAGFNTVDLGNLAQPTIIIMIVLMFIGASSGSTGGGIKTSTFVVIIKSAVSTIKGKKSVELGGRTINQDLIHKAFSIFSFAVAYNILMIIILSISEEPLLSSGKCSILDIAFEQVSAFSTVGLSTGITMKISIFGKSLLILTMFIGRVGTLTLALALSSRAISNKYKYPNAHIMIG